MKVLDISKSGKCINVVVYPGRYGNCQRQLVVPTNRQTAARDFMRGVFGHFSQAWSRTLSQAQRDRWSCAGPRVMSHPRLGQRGPLTGQQHFEGINCVRARVGLAPVWEPPEPAAFGLHPVGDLIIQNGEDGVRLFVQVNGPVTEDIMVFGQEPCSAGRSKRRNVSYLGLLGPAVGGLSEITSMYIARYGPPRPGTKVFILTCQQKDGWKGQDKVACEIVPEPPRAQQATAKPQTSQKVLMHKGCTRGAIGSAEPLAGERGEAGEGNPKDEIRRPKEVRRPKSEEGSAQGGG